MLIVCVALLLAGHAAEASQGEIDRIVSRVNGRIITQSDVRQARALKLVGDTSSDDAARRDLENRFLILGEISRASAAVTVADADVASGRQRWEAALGGGSVAALLTRQGMTDTDLQNWLRDDVRIRAYVARLFAGVPEGERSGATAMWLARLRQRAGLD
jgi:hypothetical protein